MSQPTETALRLKARLLGLLKGRAPWYALAVGAPALINFGLTPLLVRQFGLQGYAEWALIEPLILLGAAVATLGVQYGALNSVATGRTSSALALCNSLAWVLLMAPAFALAAFVPLQARFGPVAAAWLISAQITEGLALVVLNVLRGEGRAKLYGFTELARNLGVFVAVAAGVYFAVGWPHGAADILALRTISSALVIGLILSIGRTAFETPKLRQIPPLLKYGWPILIAQVLFVISNNIDRYIASGLGFTPAEISAYVVHIRMAGILNLAIIAPLNLWYAGEAMKRDIRAHEEFFNKIPLLILSVCGLALLGIEIVAPTAWPLLFPDVKLDMPLLLLIGGGIAFQGLAIAWNIGPLRAGHTQWNIIPPVVSLATLLISGPILTGAYGAHGLATSRLISAAVYALSFRILSQRIAPLRANRTARVATMAAIAIFCATPWLYTQGGAYAELALVAAIAVTFAVASGSRFARSQAQ